MEHVAPQINALFGETLGKLLGKALLWTIFSEKSAWVPSVISQHVKSAYNNLPSLGEAQENNPIEKKLLVVTGDDATLYINEVDVVNQGEQFSAQLQQNNQQASGHLEGHSNRQLLHTLLNQVNQLQTTVTQVTEAREADRVMLLGQFRTINTNIRRIASQPIRALARAQPVNGNARQAAGDGNTYPNAGGVANPLVPADLSPTPRTLYTLWQEYQVGISGRKAARLFTREEKGRVKHKYHRRKVVWDLVSLLINSGLTAQVACDRIYNVYGDDKPVTYIINRLKEDKKSGALHVTLQV